MGWDYRAYLTISSGCHGAGPKQDWSWTRQREAQGVRGSELEADLDPVLSQTSRADLADQILSLVRMCLLIAVVSAAVWLWLWCSGGPGLVFWPGFLAFAMVGFLFAAASHALAVDL